MLSCAFQIGVVFSVVFLVFFCLILLTLLFVYPQLLCCNFYFPLLFGFLILFYTNFFLVLVLLFLQCPIYFLLNLF